MGSFRNVSVDSIVEQALTNFWWNMPKKINVDKSSDIIKGLVVSILIYKGGYYINFH